MGSWEVSSTKDEATGTVLRTTFRGWGGGTLQAPGNWFDGAFRVDGVGLPEGLPGVPGKLADAKDNADVASWLGAKNIIQKALLRTVTAARDEALQKANPDSDVYDASWRSTVRPLQPGKARGSTQVTCCLMADLHGSRRTPCHASLKTAVSAKEPSQYAGLTASAGANAPSPWLRALQRAPTPIVENVGRALAHADSARDVGGSHHCAPGARLLHRCLPTLLIQACVPLSLQTL